MKATREELIQFVAAVASNLGDWKPDMRLDYGLNYLYTKADLLLEREAES